MANHKSSKKRIRQTANRKQVNKSIRSSLRTAEKNLRLSIEKKDKDKALEQFTTLSSAIDRSVRKGTYHNNKVSRKKSRLAAMINNI